MMSPFPKMVPLGLALWAVVQLVNGVGPASAEMSDPLAAVGVDSTRSNYRPQGAVSGAFKIQGSETMYPLLTRLSAEFQRYQPKVTIDVRKGGSSKAVSELLQPPLRMTGNVMLAEERASSFQLMAVSRQLAEAEVKEFIAQHGYEPTVVPVAVDAVAIYVHKDNPLSGLTLDQVDAMFSSTRKRGSKTAISLWGQLGLTDRWKEAQIQLYGRDQKSGTRAFFREHCLAGGEFSPNVHEDPGAASVVVDLSRDSGGIGYSGLGLQVSDVRVVPLAEKDGMPFVTPSSETVADQTYPLRHVLHLYMDKSPKMPLPIAVQEFLTFLVTREGEEAVIRAGFFPLPAGHAQKSVEALAGAAIPTTTLVR